MTIAIRELGLADAMMLEELLDTLSPGWTDGLAPGASGPIAFLSQPRSFAFGAYVDNSPAGLLWGEQVFRPDGFRVSNVQDLQVVADYRRRGIATALFDAATGLARRGGSARLQLLAAEDNPEGQRFCQQVGGMRSDVGDVRFFWELA